MTTPPPNNLGPLSQPWARWRTDKVLENERTLQRLSGDATNDGIQSGTTINQIARQINEIYARQTGFVERDPYSQATNNSGQATSTFELQIPRPGDTNRLGWLAVQVAANTNSTVPVDVFATFEIDGRVFHRDSRTLPDGNFDPSTWNGQKSLIGYSGFTAGPTGGGLIRVTLQIDGQFYGNGVRTISYSNIRATYQFGQIV